jgi:hypothetical protein
MTVINKQSQVGLESKSLELLRASGLALPRGRWEEGAVGISFQLVNMFALAGQRMRLRVRPLEALACLKKPETHSLALFDVALFWVYYAQLLYSMGIAALTKR